MRLKSPKTLAVITFFAIALGVMFNNGAADFLRLKVRADNAYFPLSPSNPLLQDWSNLNLITTNHDWSGVPSINGYRGDFFGTVQNIDPQTILSDYSATPFVYANITNPNSATNGSGGFGNVEFQIANPTVAFRGSPLEDAPHLDIRLDTTGCPATENIRVRYNLRDIDGGGNNAIGRVALHYRVGGTGDYTNLPEGFVADATTGPNLATLETPVSVLLPLDAKNQPEVHVRIMTSDASAVDEYVGIDNISITCGSQPTAASVVVAGRVTTPQGGGIARASLTLTSASGETKTTQTGSFGYYEFSEVPSGETYVLSVHAKRYTFADPIRVISVFDDLKNADFVSEP